MANLQSASRYDVDPLLYVLQLQAFQGGTEIPRRPSFRIGK